MQQKELPPSMDREEQRMQKRTRIDRLVYMSVLRYKVIMKFQRKSSIAIEGYKIHIILLQSLFNRKGYEHQIFCVRDDVNKMRHTAAAMLGRVGMTARSMIN